MHPQTYKSLTKARDFMRYAYGRPVSLPDVAARANLSPYHFLRVYKRAYGETPHEFLTRLRIERAKTLLARGSHNVTEACFEVGFSSLGSFSSLFAHRVGSIPLRVQALCQIQHLRPVSGSGRCSSPRAFWPCCTEPVEESNFREAGSVGPVVSSGQGTKPGGKP